MDVFCRCKGCGSCNNEALPTPGKCGNRPQKYVITSGNKQRSGYRKYCKPCLRKMELARLATKHSIALGLVPSSYVTGRAGHTGTPGNRPRIVLFGDSITQYAFGEKGFGASLADKHQRSADVMLRGYSGYNSNHAVSILDSVFPVDDPTPPVLVTVCFGANDAVQPGTAMAPVQAVPLENYVLNLKAIGAHLAKLNPPPHVVFITPPPISPEAWLETCKAKGYTTDDKPDRALARTGYYATACKGASDDMGHPCVDLFNGLMGSPGWEEDLLADGLHLSANGNQRTFELIDAAISATFPNLAPGDAPSDLPDFKEIDPNNPGATVASFLQKRKVMESSNNVIAALPPTNA